MKALKTYLGCSAISYQWYYLLKSHGVFISVLFLIHSFTGFIWWRQKQPITVQIMSAVVALPFMPDLSLCLGLHVPLCFLPFQSVPAWLPGLGCSCCILLLAYLHYITSYLNETCCEMTRDVDRLWTHTEQSKAEQDLTGSLVSFSFLTLAFMYGHHRNHYLWLLIKMRICSNNGELWLNYCSANILIASLCYVFMVRCTVASCCENKPEYFRDSYSGHVKISTCKRKIVTCICSDKPTENYCLNSAVLLSSRSISVRGNVRRGGG